LIYLFNIPGLSTSAAGRIIFVYTFSLSVICAYFFDISIYIISKAPQDIIGAIFSF
jgi:hypothetical protein